MPDAAAIVDVLAAARDAWPGVEVDAASFAAHLERIGCTGDELGRRRGTDLYLACACAAGDTAAIAAFEAAFFPEVKRAAARTRSQAHNIAEVEQRMRRVLFVAEPGRPAAIAEYAGRGGLRGWVKVIATRELLHLARRGKREVGVDDASLFDALASASDPELGYIRELYREAATRALRSALEALTDHDRSLLRYVVLDGFTVDQLGVLLGVHRATAARRVARIRESILERTRSGLATALGIADAELDSVIRLVSSRVDVSLDRILGEK
jgi:RNA polymerase sigma-70 factor (ECF subfamily)